MTRGKKVGVVLAVVMLVVASGTVLALTASTNQADATPNEQLAQEQATETTTQEQTDGDSTVTFENQTSDGKEVVVDSVTVPEGGFVTIHDSTLLDGDALGSVVGVSQYLIPGTHENVTVTLNCSVKASETLIAMPHMDTNGNQEYDFVTSEGAEDGPYVANDEVVVDAAVVTVEDAAAKTTEAAAGETTTEAVADQPETEVATEVPETEVPETEVPETEVEETEVETEVPETEEPAVETPDTQYEHPDQLVFSIEKMQIDEWSFVVGDSMEPDQTDVIEGISVQDRTIEINLSELANGESTMAEAMGTTVPTEQAHEAHHDVKSSDMSDIETYRYVIRNVDVQNVTLIVTGLQELKSMEKMPGAMPEDMQGAMTGMDEAEASVTFENQTSDGTTVTVDSVTMSEGGFVAIHDSTLLDGDALGSVVGVSEYLSAGTHENVEVTLDAQLSASETLIAMPHMDTNGNQEYDFVTSEGAEDGPYVANDEVVVDPAEVTVEGAATETTEVETTEAVETTEVEMTTEAVETTEVETTTEAVETTEVETTEVPAAPQAFEVENLQAPSTAVVGDVITVSATVTNSGEVENTEEVDFRLQGDVIESQTITLGAGESREVTFEIDTSGLQSGDYVQGIYGDQRGQVAIVTIDESATETETTQTASRQIALEITV